MPEPSVSSPAARRSEFTSARARYQAIVRRDPRAEGCFCYAVATTGVYCRPTCAARPALRKNVEFYASADAAERAGYRACLRCRPREPSQDERHARMVGAVREVLDAADEPLDLATLAERVGSSPFHLHRLFKKHVGMTPRQYAAAVRLRRVEKELGKGASVTSAIHRAGYSSSSRFYESESGALGMLPSGVRRGGAGVEMMAVARSCSLGRVLVATTSRGVCAILLGDDPKRLFADLERRFPHATVRTGDASTKAIAARVVKMIDTGIVATNLPLDLIGTAFQQRVWRALRDIPQGATTTYGEIAERIGARFAARAVGTACGQNPLAVVVPCHRVLRSDGGLGGYRWGIGRKTKLLGRERPK